MFKLNMLAISFWTLKTLNLHPEQKFNLFYYLMRLLWFISIIIYIITVAINLFTNNELSPDNIQMNADLLVSLFLVNNKYILC